MAAPGCGLPAWAAPKIPNRMIEGPHSRRRRRALGGAHDIPRLRRFHSGALVPLHSDYDSLTWGPRAEAGSGYARPILARAFSVVNIHLIRAFEALRCRSQAAISDTSCSWVAMRLSRHWLRSTPISISTMFSQLACLGT